jgi:hypothetical protein
MMKRRIAMVIYVGLIWCAASTPVFSQGGQRLGSIRAAEEAARRAILESVAGFEMVSTAEVNDMMAGTFEVSATVRGQIRRVEFVERTYDADMNVAIVRASIDPQIVKNVAGVTITFPEGKTFTRIGFGTTSPDAARFLGALRAAELDAYRQMAEYFGGVAIEGETTVKDYVMQSDTIKASFVAALFGANLVEDDPYGFEEDTAYVNLQLTVGDVMSIFGENLAYTEETFTATGWGAVAPAQAARQPVAPVAPTVIRTETRHAPVREGNLGIPVTSSEHQEPGPETSPARQVREVPYGGVVSGR